jgi:hypothetical protein
MIRDDLKKTVTVEEQCGLRAARHYDTVRVRVKFFRIVHRGV